MRTGTEEKAEAQEGGGPEGGDEPPSVVLGNSRAALLRHVDLSPEEYAHSFGWQVLHAAYLAGGGALFILSSTIYFFEYSDLRSAIAAGGYTVGSVAFFVVDSLELATAESGTFIATNVCISLMGSLCYVWGSAAYIPSIYAAFPWLGNLGFVMGSFLIFVSQLWKIYRIGQSPEAASGIWADTDARSATCVELGACIGSLCFLVGTTMLWFGDLDPTGIFTVYLIWMLGSICFTMGGCFLMHRHFALKLV